MKERPVRFDDARTRARKFMEEHFELGTSAVLVRDLVGKFRVVLDDRDEKGRIPGPEQRQALAAELHAKLGRWSPGVQSIFLVASEMFAPEELLDTGAALWADPATKNYRVIDRTVTGADWLSEPLGGEHPPRFTFFGIKGGVGRSTAVNVLAWRLSGMGRRVLVVDLDLESPGVSATLLPPEHTPDFGIVDWLVEDGVGQGDRALLEDMTMASPLGQEGAGIVVAPAGGRFRDGYEYLPKLARAYAELARTEGPPMSFGERLHDLVLELEEHVQPHVVLLDSRAGIHEIAAAAVTRMNATCLLFAMDTAQTWNGYRALFSTWREHFDRAAAFRQDLQMVAGQIPETNTHAYLESFREHAYDLFADNLYVEASAGELAEFNYDPDDPDAPHSPVRIHWSRAFQQFEPVNQPGAVTDEQVDAAYGDFVRWVAERAVAEDMP